MRYNFLKFIKQWGSKALLVHHSDGNIKTSLFCTNNEPVLIMPFPAIITAIFIKFFIIMTIFYFIYLLIAINEMPLPNSFSFFKAEPWLLY